MKAFARRPAALALIFIAVAGAAAPAEPRLSGDLKTIAGVRVLTLRGTPRENGYARGYLLAPQIMKTFRGALDIFGIKGYAFDALSKMLLPLVNRAPRYEEEMASILEGLSARLGAGALHVDALGRALTLDDLWALSALPDLHCSSFSAWGSLTPDGAPIIARNLDYSGMESLAGTGVVVVSLPDKKDRSWWLDASLAGLVGVSTGLNEHGVLTHAVCRPVTRGIPGGYVPECRIVVGIFRHCAGRRHQDSGRHMPTSNPPGSVKIPAGSIRAGGIL